jgi:succinylarginine dihydrolase
LKNIPFLTDKEKYETANYIAKQISQELKRIVEQSYEDNFTEEECDLADAKRLLLAQEVLNILCSRFF